MNEIADYALIGDCHSAALISRAGSIDWCCMPRFDSGSAFAAILDPEKGGSFEIAPTGTADPTRSYSDGTLVLNTAWTVHGSEAEVTDFFAMRSAEVTDGNDERQLVRIVRGHRGEIEFKVKIAPRFDYGQLRPWIRKEGSDHWSLIAGDDGLICFADIDLEPNEDRDVLERVFRITAGETVRFCLVSRDPARIDKENQIENAPAGLDEICRQTVSEWQQWDRKLQTGGSEVEGVGVSARVLRALTFKPSGAMVAAPTTSLPEVIGSERNWDYRYSWIRDSSFASRTLAEIGAETEADAFNRFIQRSAAGRAEDLHILYGIRGERQVRAREIAGLAGYRDSRPVRVGNGAAGQLQLDAIGELINLSWRWHRRGHSPDDDHWRFLYSLVETAAERWSDPDHGLWEWRGEPENFVHSKALCWSALDRGLRMADECMRDAPVRKWKKARDEVKEAVESEGFDSARGVFVQSFECDAMDAALLLLPSIDFIDWSDQRMLDTTDAIQEELGTNGGLIYRYRRDDGLPGEEGVFVACSFWLVECLARQGRLDRAHEVFRTALGTGSDLGLFPEQWDPENSCMLGNYPQGLSHLAHIAACMALADAEGG